MGLEELIKDWWAHWKHVAIAAAIGFAVGAILF